MDIIAIAKTLYEEHSASQNRNLVNMAPPWKDIPWEEQERWSRVALAAYWAVRKARAGSPE